MVEEGQAQARPAEPSITPLFAQVEFLIIRSKSLGADITAKLTQILEEHGGIQYSPPSTSGVKDSDLSKSTLTHIISATIDFEGYEAAEDRLIPVVTPNWVESSISKKRLANPRSHSPDPRLFFSGLVVCVADLPSGDKDAIIGGVLAFGGLYSSAITKMVTHIVALNMEPQACEAALAKGLQCKIVLPHWFDDCLRLRKRIDEGPYLLPNPEIMRKKPSDRIPETPRPDLQTAVLPTGGPSVHQGKLSVFEKKKIMLSEDLDISSHLRGTIEDLVRGGGGDVVGSISRAEIFVCQFREGQDYQRASREGKVVGSLPWLYHLITHNAWTSPLRRLLHYPIAREGLPGFKKFRISLSNYNGEARMYLENLAKVAGCEFTKTMKMDNTHLITAHMISEKCDAAKEWNINIVNHLWLEESYAKWQIQSLANTKYTYFPPRTNLSEVVGQTPIDRQALERIFFPQPVQYQEQHEKQNPPEPASAKQSTRVRSNIASSSALQPPESSNDDFPQQQPRASEGQTPRVSKRDFHRNEGSALRTPAAPRLSVGGKENETPSTAGSRGAKDRAAAKIHDLAPDIALYEKEKKRVGGVVFGGRSTNDEKKEDASRKRSVSNEESSDMEADDQGRAAKRMRKGKAPPSIRLLVSGYSKWSDDPKAFAEAKARLRDQGILVVQDHAKCTHLAAPKILRTQKFICAIAHAPVILSTNFLEDSLESTEQLETDKYLLQDPEGEKRLSLKLTEVLRRARENKGRLLQGQPIYCTENIYGGFDTYKSIVEVNGGRCLLYRARPGSLASSRAGAPECADDAEEPEEPIYVYLISGTTPEEARLWPKFQQMAQSAGKTARIVRTDWMLDLALSQRIRWDPSYELTNNDVHMADA